MAVSDGKIERLGRDRRGGIVIYQRDASGRFVYYYAHLSRYAPGLKVGDTVKRGQQIGEVGTTGLSTGNHLHFGVSVGRVYTDPFGLLGSAPELSF